MAKLIISLLLGILLRNNQRVNMKSCRLDFALNSVQIEPVKDIKESEITISPLVSQMSISKTIEIHTMTKELEKTQKVYSLCVGEPDYEPPREVVDATGEAAAKGITKYTAVNGEFSLRQAICNDLKSRKNVHYTPDQIVVSNGAKQAVLQSLMALVSPGDTVIIPAPYWPSYPDMVKLCGAIPLPLQTLPSQNYIIDPKILRSILEANPKTSCIILCNPSNPTGSVFTRQQLQDVAEVLVDFPKVMVIADEIYEQLTYDIDHVAIASLPSMFTRTVTINGFSKSHSMTGYRIGYSASVTLVAKAISKLQSQTTSSASSISQYAALRALQVDDAWIQSRRVELQQKRDLAYSMLMSIPNVSCPKPNGAFYLLPDVSAYYGLKTKSGVMVNNSHELCLQLLKDESVALVSGDAFGADSCLRISYATSFEILEESLKRLTRFLLNLE